MITLSKKQQIIISTYLEGKSQRAIARETGIDRKTIRKYIKEYEANRQELLESKNGVDDIKELQDSIVQRPKYVQEMKKVMLKGV